MSEFYVAVLETNSEGEFFATVPDLPGVNTAAATKKEALSLAIEFANDYVRDLVEDGHKVPPARDSDESEHDAEVHEAGRAMIPVEVPGKSVKISVSIDEALLIRADRAAAKVGLTRSGFFAAAVENKIREGLRGDIAGVAHEAAGGAITIRGHALGATALAVAGGEAAEPLGFKEGGAHRLYPITLAPTMLDQSDAMYVVQNPQGFLQIVQAKAAKGFVPAPVVRGVHHGRAEPAAPSAPVRKRRRGRPEKST